MPRDDAAPHADAQRSSGPPCHHVLIAGTGRAGSSFLVRYLAACGLETHLSAAGGADDWDDLANAGFEDLVLGSGNRPYVAKSPWAHRDIDDVLADPSIRLDAVIIPMRDLIEAASSRSIVELQNLHRQYRDMAERRRSWLLTGHTPGGVIYSVDPLDQARLLATGFHQLVQRLVAAEVPLILLDFTRMLADADYLYRKLAAILPARLEAHAAAAAHAGVVDPRKQRVRRELADPPHAAMADGPSFEQLDRIALAREVCRLRAALEQAQTTRPTMNTSLRAWVTDRLRRLSRRMPRLARCGRRLRGGWRPVSRARPSAV